MPSYSVRRAWSMAFARQAVSDFNAREYLLRNPFLAECHQLHYLQMAFEKTAMAHLISGGSDPYAIQSSHAYIAKVVPIIVRDAISRMAGTKQHWIIDAVRILARRVELLQPQVDNGGAVPANCEYPWTDAIGNVVPPVEYAFSINLHSEKGLADHGKGSAGTCPGISEWMIFY